MMKESIKFNDGNGKNNTSTYLGPVIHDDIAKVHISFKQNASELHKLTP